MSSIGPGIAGSVSQAAAQQSDVARARDKARNRAEREAQRMSELLEQHLHSVEDSGQTDDDPLRVKDEERNAQQQRRRGEHQKQRDDVAELSPTAENAEQPPLPPVPPLLKNGPPPPGRRLDIEA